MLVILLTALALHGYVVYQGATFFLVDARGRVADCQVVAMLTATSAIFLMMQLVHWALELKPSPSSSLWIGFAACNGAVYAGIIRQYMQFRASRHDRRMPEIRRI